MPSSNNLYQILKDHINSVGLPIIPAGLFQNLTNEYTKEVFRETLSEFISKERPEFPLKQISNYDMEDNFKKLRAQNIDKFLKTNIEVMEKFDDFLFPYSKFGLGTIDAPSVFSISSNYFHHN